LYQEALPHWLPASALPVEITATALNAATTIANAFRRDRHACIVSMFPSSQSATSFSLASSASAFPLAKYGSNAARASPFETTG
jgi:hypothetical protein